MSPTPITIEQHTADECEAASAFVSLCSSLKRFRSEEESSSSSLPLKKRRRSSLPVVSSDSESDCESDYESVWTSASSVSSSSASSVSSSEGDLLPSPYFYYRDYSEEKDADPFTPLTPPARVPNFPAKMHAILSRPDLADVITWMPHGRSWKILKKRDFETRVLPTYFDHSKLSSFVRQANGWGFRRVTTGADRNTYYHPRFLRGLPHLCKAMKRPGVAKKVTADPAYEPDFAKISGEHPIGNSSTSDDSILLTSCTLKSGPKARMPVHLGIASNQPSFTPAQKNAGFVVQQAQAAPVAAPAVAMTALQALNNPVILAAALQQVANMQKAQQQAQQQAQAQQALNQLLAQQQNNDNNSPNNASFAAGFAAATALQNAMQQPQQAAWPSLMLRQ